MYISLAEELERRQLGTATLHRSLDVIPRDERSDTLWCARADHVTPLERHNLSHKSPVFNGEKNAIFQGRAVISVYN